MLILLGPCGVGAAHASSRTDLDSDWQFRADPEDSGLASGWICADRVHVENLERLQLTVYPNNAEHSADDGAGAAVESIQLHFGAPP